MAPDKLLQLHLIVLLNGGLAASIAMIGYLILGNVFGITTSLHLTELSRPTHRCCATCCSRPQAPITTPSS